jgi:hypothetical protein
MNTEIQTFVNTLNSDYKPTRTQKENKEQQNSTKQKMKHEKMAADVIEFIALDLKKQLTKKAKNGTEIQYPLTHTTQIPHRKLCCRSKLNTLNLENGITWENCRHKKRTINQDVYLRYCQHSENLMEIVKKQMIKQGFMDVSFKDDTGHIVAGGYDVSIYKNHGMFISYTIVSHHD